MQIDEHHRDASAEHVVERRRRALVGDVQDVDPGAALERLARHDAGGVAAGIGQLAGIGLGVGDQLGQRLGRESGSTTSMNT